MIKWFDTEGYGFCDCGHGAEFDHMTESCMCNRDMTLERWEENGEMFEECSCREGCWYEGDFEHSDGWC